MRIYIGADHAGYTLKEGLKDHIESLGYEVTDLGAFSEDTVDYPDIAREVAEKVYENGGMLGVLICGTGTGMCMAANKHTGIRAASCTDEQMAMYARSHNHANILCLGQRVLNSEDLAKQITKKFLETEFEGGRHEKRVDKIMEVEKD